MPIHYTNSPCCQGTIYRYGRRRRQCAICRKTWSVWQRPRGRKALAVDGTLATRYLARELPSLKVLARTDGCTTQAISARLTQSLVAYLAGAHLAYEAELARLTAQRIPLVVVVDALWHHLEQQAWTTYLVLVKPITQDRAFILKPVISQGHECLSGWQETLGSIPPLIRGLIQGVVCDGGGPLNQALRAYPWITQRCHFHLLSQLQNYATTGSRSTDPAFSRYLMRQTHLVLRTTTSAELNRGLANLRVAQAQTTSRGIRRVLRGLFRDLVEFRAYLQHPELNLPTTTNAAESTVQMVRDLLYRARGFRTATSYGRWITARLYLQKYIICRGNLQQK